MLESIYMYVDVYKQQYVSTCMYTHTHTHTHTHRYVELLVEHYVLPCCQAASLASLIEGFYDIIPRAILLETSTGEEGEEASSGLSALDLELMVLYVYVCVCVCVCVCV